MNTADLDMWERVRRYAVPRSMIERAAERRAAGDWRGACEAAGIRVHLRLGRIRRNHGREIAEAVEEDLLHLVPDLVRWHLPRRRTAGRYGGRGLVDPYHQLALAAYPQDGARKSLWLSAPRPPRESWRLTLAFGGGVTNRDWSGLRCLWDDRRTAGLLALEGGRDRAPFFEPDGRVRDAGLLPRGDPGPADPAARAEWITLLQEQGRLDEAATAVAGLAGILAADVATAKGWFRAVPWAAHKLGPALVRLLEAEPSGRLRLGYSTDHHGPTVSLAEDGGLRFAEYDRRTPEVATAWWHASPDLALVRAGRLTPEDLHPLVSRTLFPARAVPEGPTGPRPPRPPVPAKIRCRGETHEVWFENGELRTPGHTAQERQREDALAAFGGTVTGCFAVPRVWDDVRNPVPRELQEQCEELFSRMEHGDAEGVLRMLELGHDPAARYAPPHVPHGEAPSGMYPRRANPFLPAPVPYRHLALADLLPMHLALHKWPPSFRPLAAALGVRPPLVRGPQGAGVRGQDGGGSSG
ncbi:ankyrin repeat domain-containing protein [Actinomadura macrotermitis]|uniref:Uncharacterized protein n=1 Tax=Actinomadura macrotermitis TaxID=2585200 RepID=A0A7K0BR88_9ACTN|nr:ankyrin repeat domain-containing protein [Actinomadura macrotermitis]MQY03661.1 hypothetical protein [Actinomadura macrotermitis]